MCISTAVAVAVAVQVADQLIPVANIETSYLGTCTVPHWDAGHTSLHSVCTLYSTRSLSCGERQHLIESSIGFNSR